MILDTLTKFNMRRKLWMTPEHPLCIIPKDLKIMYSAAIILQAQVNQKTGPLNNYELERLLKSGLKLESSDIAWALRNARNNEAVVNYLLENLKTDRERIFLMMDLINVSISDGEITDDSKKSVQLFAELFLISRETLNLLQKFIEYAYEENIEECQRFAAIIEEKITGIEISDLKYYIMQLTENTEFTQKILDEKKHCKLIDRYNIYEDIVLNDGMNLVIDNAVIRIFGNISLNGGNLFINNSKIIRKSGRHRACISINTHKSSLTIFSVEVDCRNYGMFIRAKEGTINIENSNIYHTTRGAAVCFLGKELIVSNTGFFKCYSPEDGGAIMVRGGNANINGCHFYDCEARRGGAIYGINSTIISKCNFIRCNVADYGAAIYYSGKMKGNIDTLEYLDCHPSGAEIVQNITGKPLSIRGECYIGVSTIIDCPISIENTGKLIIENANIYLNYPLKCFGRLFMRNTKVVSNYLDKGDMIYLDNAKECKIHHCELDGMLKTGGVNILNTRIYVTKSLFRNMGTGRAIYNAYQPEISECIFNFCQKGGIYSHGGNIIKCVFINCRAKSGSGIQMYGKKGTIENCVFKRCVSEYSGGAIDRVVGMKVTKCTFEECKPNNIS